MANNRYAVSSIDRALDILLLIFRERREMGITEIAADLGIYKSTVHRALGTLQERGFIEQNPVTNKYWLGIKLFTLGMLYRDKMKIQELARPFTEKLAEQCREVVHLGILESDEHEPGRVVVIDKVETQKVLKLTPAIGTGTKAYCSALGKALLAYQPDEYLQRIAQNNLERYTPNTITDVQELKRELCQIKEQGYSIDREEIELGLICIGAPIFTVQNRVIAAISVSGPTTRLTPDRMPEIIAAVKEAAARISERIGD
ncbi:MAG: IclR family transcriptional regulator [Thermacetogeniaceae bacterium]